MADEYDLSTHEGRLAVLLAVREGAEVGKLVAEMRPQRDVLGDYLGKWVDLLDSTLSLHTTASAEPRMREQDARRANPQGEVEDGEPDDDVDLSAWRASAGTTAACDVDTWQKDGWPDEILNPYREQDEGPALRFGRRIMHPGIDHLRGVAVLLTDDRVSRPPLALSRVVLDAAAHLNYVLQPGIDAQQRLLRVLNEALARAGEDLRDAEREDNQDAIAEAEAEIEAIRTAVGTRAAFQRPRRGVPFIGEKQIYTSKMINELLGQDSSWYELSGIVHNKEDEGWRMMLGLSLGGDNPHKSSYIALHSLAPILGVVKLLESIELYTGWDLSPCRESGESLCQLWAAAAGVLDDSYRERAKEQRLADGSTEQLAREFYATAALIPLEERGGRRRIGGHPTSPHEVVRVLDDFGQRLLRRVSAVVRHREP